LKPLHPYSCKFWISSLIDSTVQIGLTTVNPERLKKNIEFFDFDQEKNKLNQNYFPTFIHLTPDSEYYWASLKKLIS